MVMYALPRCFWKIILWWEVDWERRPRAVKLLLLFLLFSSLACNAANVCISFDSETAYGPSARANHAFHYLSS